MKQQRTYQQVETAKERAVRFLENVLQDSMRAGEVADESVSDYASRRHIQIISNPAKLSRCRQVVDVLEVVDDHPARKRIPMAKITNKATKADLQETVNDASDKVTELLDPELTREELVRKAKELDELLNGSDDDDEEDDDDEDDDDEDEDED